MFCVMKRTQPDDVLSAQFKKMMLPQYFCCHKLPLMKCSHPAASIAMGVHDNLRPQLQFLQGSKVGEQFKEGLILL